MSLVYLPALEVWKKGTLDWDDPAGVFHLALLYGSGADDETLSNWSDVFGLEVSGAGYSRLVVSGRSVSIGSGVVKITATSPFFWASLNVGNADQAVIFRVSDGLLVCLNSFSVQATQGGDLTLNIPSTGLASWSNS